MDMTYTLKGQTAPLSIRIPFDPPLLGYEEVKPRLMSMKVDAEEALGMVRLLFTYVPSSHTENGSSHLGQEPND